MIPRPLLAIAMLVLPLVAHAESQIPIVTTDELKRMLDAKENVFLADALSPIEFAEESIAGSVNVPYSALRDGKAKLPADKARRLVFYCKGPKCTKSVKTAGLAVQMGYTNVRVYSEGLPEWVKRGYPANVRKVYPDVDVPAVSPAALKEMLDAKQPVVVLDVRDDEDARAGGIAGALHLDIETLDGRLASLPTGKKIVIVDMHGKQTQQVGRFLAWKGYRDLAKLDGGFVGGWLKAGLPVAR